MNESIKCPYCNEIYPLVTYANTGPSTLKIITFDIHLIQDNRRYFDSEFYQLFLSRCPSCKEETIWIEEYTDRDDNNPCIYRVKPNAVYNSYPDYIPIGIRNDYVEACSILHLSPKASATLARRCLQGMIRDFWGISKNRLVDEIDALKEKIPAAQWKAINALRSLGNIGAHMEKDVNCIIDIDEGEAEKLIKLVELLIKQWYIDRHEQETLFADLVTINEEKQAEKKSAGQNGAK